MAPPTETMIDPIPAREAVHDLRNLFSVISGAGRLLERDDCGRNPAILAALQRAAVEGDRLTTSLLAGVHPRPAIIDLRERLLALAPMLQSLAHRTVLTSHVEAAPLRVHFDPATFDAVMLELIANARSANPRTGIVISARSVGARIWISVLDDGCGMAAKPSLEALAHGANGTGLGRVRHAVTAAHGRMRLRSRPNRGTIVTITLPSILALGEGSSGHHGLNPEEKSNEKRQPLAA